MAVTASAPAKTILFGKHFVVYGEPAIVLAIDKRTYSTVTPRKDNRIYILSKDLGDAGYFENDHFFAEKDKGDIEAKLRPIMVAAKKVLDKHHGKAVGARVRAKLKNVAKVKFIVLKLGGSVITKKEKLKTPNFSVIRLLAKEIADANVERLIIVHGGGSYGHPLAKQYEIREGYKKPSQIEGFSRTHQAMLELNRLVVDILISHNIPAFSVSPSSCTVAKAGRIQILYDSTLTRLLKTGFVPVLFGDTIVDNSIGFTILSGDQLVATLATRFGAGKIIFGADVDGLYTADPKFDDSAKLIRHITLQKLKTLLHNIEGAKATDVTGGMLGKISELIPAIDAGIPAVIVNATVEGNVYKALRGEKVVGTLVEKE